MVYINDLPEKIENITKLFADDSKIISVIKEQTDVDRFQKDLDMVGDWYSNSDMTLNVDKCKVMPFGKSNPKANHYMTDMSGMSGMSGIHD